MIISIDWAPNTLTGWGCYCLNLALAFSGDLEVEFTFPDGQAMIDPLRGGALIAMRQASNGKHADVFLHALGNDVMPEPATPRDRTLGVIFFEEPLTSDAIDRAKRYPLILAGSDWNTKLLKDAGANAVTVHQGVDRTLFHAAPKLMNGRFAVFSGGKAEHRKGQDLMLKAFSIFAAKHDDAVLVTAWHSPWPMLAAKMGAPLKDGALDVVAWAQTFGIPQNKIIALGMVHNPMMPQIYREMACAVFPNRAEGGTNLVAMEAMACGVPTAISDNTGHRDIKTIGLHRMAQEKFDSIGRGETPVDEIVQQLEWFYDVSAEQTLSDFYWSDTAKKIKEACKECVTIPA